MEEWTLNNIYNLGRDSVGFFLNLTEQQHYRPGNLLQRPRVLHRFVNSVVFSGILDTRT